MNIQMNEFHGIGICDIGDMKKKFGSTLKMKTPNSFLGVAMVVYGHDFFVETLAILNIQLTIVFHLVVTLYEGGGTLGMVAMLDKDPILTTFPHSTSKANKMKML